MLYPLQFKSIFQERIWGGRRLQELYGKALPPEVKIGESWEISDRDEAQSIVLNGRFAGKSLRWIMEHHERALLGSARSINGRFPLLVKILDAQEKLSLQVHPPAIKAAEFGGEPKTEIWYIAHAAPGAELYVGLKPGVTRDSFERKILDGTVADCFHRVPVRAGDAMFLPSGRVHAIGAGLLIYEIQQNSDTTFRVFDWNRKDKEGRPRPLHVQQSLECIDFHDIEPQAIRPEQKPKQCLLNDPLFSIHLHHVPPAGSFREKIASAAVVAVTEGSARIETGSFALPLAAGGFCLVPASLGEFQVSSGTGGATLLVGTPG